MFLLWSLTSHRINFWTFKSQHILLLVHHLSVASQTFRKTCLPLSHSLDTHSSVTCQPSWVTTNSQWKLLPQSWKTSSPWNPTKTFQSSSTSCWWHWIPLILSCLLLSLVAFPFPISCNTLLPILTCHVLLVPVLPLKCRSCVSRSSFTFSLSAPIILCFPEIFCPHSVFIKHLYADYFQIQPTPYVTQHFYMYVIHQVQYNKSQNGPPSPSPQPFPLLHWLFSQ